MSARVGLATASEVPDLDEDGPALLTALAAHGLQGEPVVWTDDDVDYRTLDLVVVRCTWDYHSQLSGFLAWSERVAAATEIVNSPAVLAWNTHKTYLRTLAERGLPVVETTWLEPGDQFRAPDEGEYVVKPAVSAGSRDTNRYVAGYHDELAVAHVSGLLCAGRTVMVQPYLHSVDSNGETALLFFAGRFSHAIRKGPLLEQAGEPVVGLYKEETVEPREPTPAEREVAESVLDAVDDAGAGASRDELLYARVDLVPGSDGSPVLLELELAEPSMFLVHDGSAGAAAADRFASAIAARVR